MHPTCAAGVAGRSVPANDTRVRPAPAPGPRSPGAPSSWSCVGLRPPRTDARMRFSGLFRHHNDDVKLSNLKPNGSTHVHTEGETRRPRSGLERGPKPRDGGRRGAARPDGARARVEASPAPARGAASVGPATTGTGTPALVEGTYHSGVLACVASAQQTYVRVGGGGQPSLGRESRRLASPGEGHRVESRCPRPPPLRGDGRSGPPSISRPFKVYSLNASPEDLGLGTENASKTHSGLFPSSPEKYSPKRAPA